MAVTDRLMDNLRVHVPGAIDNQIKQEIWNTVNDMCREGHLWRETIEIPLTEGEAVYAVETPGAEVIKVFGIAHETADMNGALFNDGYLVLGGPTPRFKDTTLPAFVQVALAPALDAGSDVESLIPVDMWSTHHQMLFDGTLGRLMGQPMKPFTNPALAAYHMKAYRSELVQARHVERTGGIPGAQMWRFPRWAR